MTVRLGELVPSADTASALSNLGARSWATGGGGETEESRAAFPLCRARLYPTPPPFPVAYTAPSSSLLPLAPSFLPSAASFFQALPVSVPPTCVPLGTAHLEDHGD